MMTVELPTAPNRRHPLMADEGFPVSGDRLREVTYDNHPTQPFHIGDVLWPLMRGDESEGA